MAQDREKVASEYRAYAEAFKDSSVVKAYDYRPPYPAEVFTILAELCKGEPQHVLDVGAGTGEIARNLVGHVERIDAVDFSQAMIEQGKQLPNGNHPRLHWLYGRVEEVRLDPPYALITAGQSLHWMDWSIVMPLFRRLLIEGGYLATVYQHITPDPWTTLSEILPHYRTDSYQSQLHDIQKQSLFQKVGEQVTAPIPYVQSIDDYIESYHGRAGLSRERMGLAQANAFDQEAKKILLQTYRDGMITFQVVGSVAWGFPTGL